MCPPNTPFSAAHSRKVCGACYLAEKLQEHDINTSCGLQDLNVVERMVVKMECGSASLIRHVSLPSLRSAAHHLIESSAATHTLGMDLISRRSQPSGVQGSGSTQGTRARTAGRLSVLGLHSAPQNRSTPSGGARRSSVHFKDAENEPSAGGGSQAEALQVWAEKLAAGDVTVLRLAALQRWVASGEYENLLERCADTF